jgi:hypothetical protein
MSDHPKKIISPEGELVLPPVFDSNKYEVLSFQLETVHLNGVCTTNLLKFVLDIVHKISEDFAILKSDNASLKSQSNKFHEKVGQP